MVSTLDISMSKFKCILNYKITIFEYIEKWSFLHRKKIIVTQDIVQQIEMSSHKLKSLF